MRDEGVGSSGDESGNNQSITSLCTSLLITDLSLVFVEMLTSDRSYAIGSDLPTMKC